jgi:hypothetical protein
MLTGSCLCGACRWTFNGDPGHATACNCTACRRYGVLWIYDYEDERIQVTGPVTPYTRPKAAELSFDFCPVCGCLVRWRGLRPNAEGRRRVAVNVRLADDPAAVAHLPIDHFDGLATFTDLPGDGRTVHDMWF